MGFYDREYAHESQPGQPAGYPARHRPSYLLGGSLVYTLIAANATIFLLGAVSPQINGFLQGGVTLDGRLVPGFAELRPILVMKGQIWRLFTAQYLHANFVHVLFNMWALYIFGRLVEPRWSTRRFFGIYTACGLAGNLFYTILGAQGWINPATAAVGASGCIYGMLGIAAILAPNVTLVLFPLPIPIRIRTLAIVLGAIAFFTIQRRGSNYGGEACHLAGLVFGLWWARWGDAWWSGTQWRFLPRRDPKKPKSRWNQNLEEEQADGQEVDRILKKVYEGGIHTLTDREKRILQAATERQRQREASAGRVDRL